MFAACAISHRVRAANHAVFLRAYKNQSAVSHVQVSYEIVPEFSVIYSLMNFDQVFTLNCNVSFWKNVVCVACCILNQIQESQMQKLKSKTGTWHIGATWRIRLNHLSATAMRSYQIDHLFGS